MRFQANNLSAPQEYTRSYNGFLGLDYTNAKLDISDKRSPDMQNFVYKDGINQKRNGYDQILKIDSEGNFNGFWEFVDSDKNVHRIAHVGTKFYKVIFSKDNFPYDNKYESLEITYLPLPFVNTDGTEWNNYLSGIKDRRSFAVVRGNRLYILCGIFLVYGSWDNGKTWELRAVRENEDTYIPTTTTNIRHINSGVTSTRASFEEVNMMTLFRKNKLFGENGGEIAFERYSPSDFGKEFENTFNKGFQFSGKPEYEVKSVQFTIEDQGSVFGTLEVSLEKTASQKYLNYNSSSVKILPDPIVDAETQFKTKCPAFSCWYTYTDNLLNIKVQFGFATETASVSYSAPVCPFSYQLDSTNIYMAYDPVLKITKDNKTLEYKNWVDIENIWYAEDEYHNQQKIYI